MKEGVSMLKIAVCDDEKIYLNFAMEFLAKYEAARGIQLETEQFTSSSELLYRLNKGEKYDIFLLDICMPEITGMTIATELREKSIDSPIIFLTSTPDFAVQAFGVNATHYLLKPYCRKDFFDAMDKALHIIDQQPSKKILLKTTDGYHNIEANKIVYCESANHNQCIRLMNGEILYVRCSSTELFNKLSPCGCYYQCGKTYIINLEHINKLMADSAVMENGDKLVIPRRTIPSLKNAYLDYLR